jgi:hypothetical protein
MKEWVDLVAWDFRNTGHRRWQPGGPPPGGIVRYNVGAGTNAIADWGQICEYPHVRTG